MIKPKYRLSGGWFLHLAGQGSQIAPLPFRQLLNCNKQFKILIKQKYSMFKIFVTVDKHLSFKSFIRQTASTVISLEHLSSNAENSFVSNFKIADYF